MPQSTGERAQSMSAREMRRPSGGEAELDAKFSSLSPSKVFINSQTHSFFFVVALLCGLLLSSRSYFCCIFSRDTSLEGLLREEKGGLRFFLLGLWVRVKNVVGVLVADANAWMQILNFKCVRRVRLPAKEGLNCSSSRLAVMMLARRRA